MRMANDRLSINDIVNNFTMLEPTAYADLGGRPLAPNLVGKALFYQLTDGILLTIAATGIPEISSDGTHSYFHGFHIHDKGNCSPGTLANPFPSTDGHWNPTDQPHPFHYGDLPPLMSTNGTAVMAIYIGSFSVDGIIGKSLVIHEKRDDFTSQLAGDSGKKLACGVILKS